MMIRTWFLSGALALTSLVVAGCDPGPAPPRAAAFEGCGACDGALECVTVRADGWLFEPDFSASQCTLRCGRDETCEALHPDAYCATSDVCTLPCADGSECPAGASCQRGACLGGDEGDGAPAPIVEPGPSHLATGADVAFAAWELPCAAGSITYDVVPHGILEVTDLVFGAATGGCTLDATVRALAPGSAAIVVRDLGGRELSRHEITVEDPTTITVGDFVLFGDDDPILRRGDLDEIVLGSTEGLGVVAIGRDGDDARLALGGGARWSIDDPLVASVEAFGQTAGDAAFAVVTPLRAGETTLRISIGGHERAIPVRVSAE